MIVYTCVTRKDCPVPEQEIKKPSNTTFVCFHSIDIPKNNFWVYEKIKEEISPRYTWTKVKLLSHEYIQEDSIWYDPKLKITKLLTPNHDFTTHVHPFRKCFIDELIDWLVMPIITIEEAITILRLMSKLNYNFNTQESYISSVIARKYNLKVIEHNKLWFRLWNKYKKRNQIWLYLSNYLTKINIHTVAHHEYSYCPKHQPYEWANNKLKIKNLSELPKVVKYINKELKIPYQINSEVLKFRFQV